VTMTSGSGSTVVAVAAVAGSGSGSGSTFGATTGPRIRIPEPEAPATAAAMVALPATPPAAADGPGIGPAAPAALDATNGSPDAGVFPRSASASRALLTFGGRVRRQYKTVRNATRPPIRIKPPTTRRSWVSAESPLEPLAFAVDVEVEPGTSPAGAAVVVEDARVVEVVDPTVVEVEDGLVVVVERLVVVVVFLTVVVVVVGSTELAVVVVASVVVGAEVVVDEVPALLLVAKPRHTSAMAANRAATRSATRGVRIGLTTLVPLTVRQLRPVPRTGNLTADVPDTSTSSGRRSCAEKGRHRPGDTLPHASA